MSLPISMPNTASPSAFELSPKLKLQNKQALSIERTHKAPRKDELNYQHNNISRETQTCERDEYRSLVDSYANAVHTRLRSVKVTVSSNHALLQ